MALSPTLPTSPGDNERPPDPTLFLGIRALHAPTGPSDERPPVSPLVAKAHLRPDLAACGHCGGRGCRLVDRHDGLCAHCARQQGARFCPHDSPWCQNHGFTDVSPRADGAVLKRLECTPAPPAEESTGDDDWPVVDGTRCTLHYVTRLASTGDIVGTTRDEVDGTLVGGADEPFRFAAHRDGVVPGVELALATMAVGERARFIVRADHAFGEAGDGHKVGPGEDLDFDLELLATEPPLPRLPSRAELERSRAEREAAEAKQLAEDPLPAVPERVAASNAERTKGNDRFNAGELTEAKRCYDAAFVNVFCTKEEWNDTFTDQDKAMINEAKFLIHLNRAMVKLRLQMHNEALWDCDKALELNPQSVKGHYRRAKVFLARIKEDLAKEEQGQYWDVEKSSEQSAHAHECLEQAKALSGEGDRELQRTEAELRKLDRRLVQCMQRYQAEQKKLYRDKMMGGLHAKYLAQKADELPPPPEAAVFDDMPQLEEDEEEEEGA